jgi:hypothetical protein
VNGGNIAFQDGNGVARGFYGYGPGGIMSGGAITDFGLSAGAGGTVRIPRAGAGVNAFAVGPNGNVTIAAPASGEALVVSGAIGVTGATPAVTAGQTDIGVTTTGTVITTAGGIALPALASTFWVANVNGVKYGIPCFAL